MGGCCATDASPITHITSNKSLFFFIAVEFLCILIVVFRWTKLQMASIAVKRTMVRIGADFVKQMGIRCLH